MVESLDVIGLLKEEMSTDEIHLKVNAIHRMRTVIASINNSQIVESLIPYLQTLITGSGKEDDEVLFAIAEEIGKVYNMIGVKTIFLPLLESLAESDETVVREEAVKSLSSIAEQLTDAEMQNVFSPLVIRLAQNDNFIGRVSSTSLFIVAYQKSGPNRERLRKKFIELC